MPHTSRRRKADNSRKRREVLDDEGWTRVTTKSRSSLAQETQAVIGGKYSPSRYPLREPVFPIAENLSKSEVPPGASLEGIKHRYHKVERLWLASDSYVELQTALRRYLETAHKVENCTLFGTGSYCGLSQGWIERHEVALVQTAAFVSVVDLIGKSRE